MAEAAVSNRDGLHETLVGRARDLVPVLRGRAAIPDRTRTLPRETHDAFVEAGFYRILQPARYGGFEADLATMIDIAAELGRGCGSSTWARLAEQPTVQARVAESGAEIDAAWSVLLKDCADAAAITEAGKLADLETRTRWRRNNSYAVQLCLRAVDRLYALAGMRAMEPASPVARIWRDIRAASSQVGTAWDPQATNYARALFGLPLSDPRAKG